MDGQGRRVARSIELLLVDGSSDLTSLLEYVFALDGWHVRSQAPHEAATLLASGMGQAYDVVVWDVSPACVGRCAPVRHLVHDGRFATTGLVLTTTHRAMLQRLLPDICTGRVVLEKPYDLEALRTAVRSAVLRESAFA